MGPECARVRRFDVNLEIILRYKHLFSSFQIIEEMHTHRNEKKKCVHVQVFQCVLANMCALACGRS